MSKWRVVRIVVGAAAGAVALAAIGLWMWLGPTTVDVRRSPDRRHKAVLRRFDGIDVNFQVLVDGRKVFWSPDFAPVGLDFREGLAWDRSGRRVLLRVAGESIFGYDADSKTVLSDSELLDVDLPSFKEFGFEGRLAQRPEATAQELPNNELQRTSPAQAMAARR